MSTLVGLGVVDGTLPITRTTNVPSGYRASQGVFNRVYLIGSWWVCADCRYNIESAVKPLGIRVILDRPDSVGAAVLPVNTCANCGEKLLKKV